MADKYINETGLQTVVNWIKNTYATDSDLDTLSDRVDDIVAEGGEPNVIEVVKQNGTALAITDKIVINNASGNLYRSPLTSLALPSDLYNNYTCDILYASVDCGHNNYPAWALLASIYDTGVNFYAMSGGSRNSSPNYTLSAYIFGTLS